MNPSTDRGSTPMSRPHARRFSKTGQVQDGGGRRRADLVVRSEHAILVQVTKTHAPPRLSAEPISRQDLRRIVSIRLPFASGRKVLRGRSRARWGRAPSRDWPTIKQIKASFVSHQFGDDVAWATTRHKNPKAWILIPLFTQRRSARPYQGFRGRDPNARGGGHAGYECLPSELDRDATSLWDYGR